jgi:hypothetical protein
MSNNRIKMLAVLVGLIAVLPAVWLVSEVRWAYVNNPEGRFNKVAEYLAQSRQPSRVTKVTKNNRTYFVAYGPTDRWLAVPSGTAAYIFDETGQMIEWSADSGDDGTFQKKWPLPHDPSSIEELRRL